MKAIIEKQMSNARNYGGEKETVSKYIILDKTGKQFVDCRVYMGRSRNSSTVYASIWVNGTNVHTSGKGTGGGYGYHKESAAIADAIGNAGVTLWGCPYSDENGMTYVEKPNPDYKPFEERTPEEQANKGYDWHTPRTISYRCKENLKQRVHFGGYGETAIRVALLAIAKAAGLKGKPIFVSL